jgi:hypothetical protein
MDEQFSQTQESTVPEVKEKGLRGFLLHMCKKCKIFAVVGVVLLLASLSILHFMTRTPSGSVEIVRETPNGNVVILTPPTSETPQVTPEIVKDSNGREYVTGEIMVEFNTDVTQDQAQKIITDAGATVKQHFVNMPLFLVGISMPGVDGVNKAVSQFRMMREVKNVGPNYLTEVPTP